jgi:hypothetical protein
MLVQHFQQAGERHPERVPAALRAQLQLGDRILVVAMQTAPGGSALTSARSSEGMVALKKAGSTSAGDSMNGIPSRHESSALTVVAAGARQLKVIALSPRLPGWSVKNAC